MSAPTCTIRAATPDDAAQLAALAIQVWLHTYATEGVDRASAEYVLGEFTTDAFLQKMADPAMTLLLAYWLDNLAGYALIHEGQACPQNAGNRFKLDKLYVQEHLAGRGVGAALLQACKERIAEKGGKALWLSMYSENHPALAFYRKQGLAVCGTTYFELGGEYYENLVLTTVISG